MRYALIGCGRIAPNHITAAKENHLDIVALCDLDIHKAEAFRSEHELGEVPIYTDYEKLLEEVSLDLVAVATSSGDHAKISLAALKHNIHVIVEKPIALSLDDADAMIQEAKERGLKLCVNHQNRFNPTIQKIRQAVEEKKLGKLLYGSADIRWFRGKDYYDQAPWRGTYQEDGGALMNQCIHNLDLLRWMMGDEIDEVYGVTTNLLHDYLPVEDLGLGIIRFSNGTLGKIEGTVDVYPNGLEETLAIFGSQGTVMAGGMSVNHMEVWNVKGEGNALSAIQQACNENPENVYGFGHVPLYRDMIDCIETGRDPLVDGPAGRRALELVLAIYLASKEGKPVQLPLYHVSTMDFV